MSRGYTAREWIGSLLHWLVIVVSAPLWALASLTTWPLSYPVRYRVTIGWAHLVIRSFELLCGVRYRIEGLENIPAQPAVVMAKHQSVWETLALARWFRPQTWVLKRSLLRIPFFGWGLRLLEPIAIDRQSAAAARQEVLRQGVDRLQRGRWVVVFPEGTRMPPGQKGRYRSSGAEVAQRAGRPVVPVAHNAGALWPRDGLLRRSGTLEVRIGPPIPTEGRSPAEVTAEVEAWIEARMAELPQRAGS
ncbi:lysophospholipid acyltransferase family protein [Halorhodospira neutriphila]|uniref:1-acyl-sn-glycerol-3-phosphate acyltransferase n=1 Tax=Halorhodospira neutriphila TaxID=168379 RepID=A0ABS1E2F7_9GAMM|nr:lysophospholipid acyltransferase family protein [Halorhodospira neutriphila]MBK1725961.1 1-acyl-sn-glycerol-3-phosphate acyltransferase [Halorhodospira neutriphila]